MQDNNVQEIKKLTTWQVLRNKFPAEEYVLIEEVSNASGFSRSRSLDFMVINLWESRGLAVTGIERKSNRGDWLKEIKNPSKQERHFKHCEYFYLLTDREGVAKLEEIPDTWGWYHINGNGTCKTMKQAPKLNPLPIGKSLMCAMLRRAADKKSYVHSDSMESVIQERVEKLNTQTFDQNKRHAEEYRALFDKVKQFESTSGVSISYKYGPNLVKIGEVVKVIMNHGVDNYKQNIERIERQLKNMHEGVLKNIETINNFKTPELDG